MKIWMTAVLAAAFLAACDSGNPGTTGKQAPTTASGGATGASPNPAPTGERSSVPAAPKANDAAEAKPDPGDANDHSSPQHDARKQEKSGD